MKTKKIIVIRYMAHKKNTVEVLEQLIALIPEIALIKQEVKSGNCEACEFEHKTYDKINKHINTELLSLGAEYKYIQISNDLYETFELIKELIKELN